jgi:hypothetical protein
MSYLEMNDMIIVLSDVTGLVDALMPNFKALLRHFLLVRRKPTKITVRVIRSHLRFETNADKKRFHLNQIAPNKQCRRPW